jgi:hypothetical protein
LRPTDYRFFYLKRKFIVSNITQFFEENPLAPELLNVGGQLFLAGHYGAAEDCAKRIGAQVEVVKNPSLAAKCDTQLAAKSAEIAAKQGEIEALKLRIEEGAGGDMSELQGELDAKEAEIAELRLILEANGLAQPKSKTADPAPKVGGKKGK